MGARPMARLIQDKVKRAIADELLFGKLADGGKVNLDVNGGDLSVDTESPEKLPAVVE
jgi:ATP-dependent Clp protease ATP-binding subunit ClpA